MKRPQTLDEVIGNPKLKRCLKIAIDAAKQESRALPHCLFQGCSGTGKTTLAFAAAHEYGTKCIALNCASIDKADQLIQAFVQAPNNSVIFLDEIHALPEKFQELLYTALEDKVLTLENNKKSIAIQLNNFTVFAATTNIGLLNGPLLNRFPYHLFIEEYTQSEMTDIVLFYAAQKGAKMDRRIAESIASKSKNTPRVAYSRLLWILDYFRSTKAKPTYNSINNAFDLIGIDENGLDKNDRRYLEILIENEKPLGLKAIASMMDVTESTIEEHIEPYLLSKNLILKTPRGRVFNKNHEFFNYIEEEAMSYFDQIMEDI